MLPVLQLLTNSLNNDLPEGAMSDIMNLLEVSHHPAPPTGLVTAPALIRWPGVVPGTAGTSKRQNITFAF